VRRKHRYLKSSNSLIGYSEAHITVDADSSQSKKNVDRSASLNYIIDLVLSNSSRPLRITSLVGLMASFISLAYFMYIIIIATFKENIVEGWLTTNVIMTMMFLMQFFVLTILSEYIARILDETRDEPLYFIEEESTSKTTTYKQITDNIDSSFNIVEF
jgi:dolichol-phosphate mannosyltransferase